MKIVTYATVDGDSYQALTAEEFRTVRVDDWDEWVWQDQPSKEAAIARHEEAHDAWRSRQDAGLPELDTY